MGQIGRVLLTVGVVMVIAGGIAILLGKIGVGSLPGDLSFRRGNTRIFIPIGTSILISVVLTILLNLFLRR